MTVTISVTIQRRILIFPALTNQFLILGSRVQVARAWRRACLAAGLPGRIPHDFRGTAVRNLERAGMPRSVAMELIGHRTESVYQRYDIVSERDLTDGVKTYAVAGARVRRIFPMATQIPEGHEKGNRRCPACMEAMQQQPLADCLACNRLLHRVSSSLEICDKCNQMRSLDVKVL
jgi:hypothetical protein